MEHSLLQVSDQARDCLGLTGALALKPFEPGIIAIALEISIKDANRSMGDLVDFGLLTRPDVRYQITMLWLTPMPKNDSLRRAMRWPAWRIITIHSSANNGCRIAGYALLDPQLDHIQRCNLPAIRRAGGMRFASLPGHWIIILV